MKKIFNCILVFMLFFSMFVPFALAIDPPEIDDIKSPVDANKQKISGTTEPGALVNVTGGPANIAPTTADSKGNFEITVGLEQNTINKFLIRATNVSGDQSDPATVEIEENEEKAKELEEKEGIDNIAPNSPKINDVDSPVDADSIKITGTAEPESIINVTGDDKTTTVTDKNGNFEVKIFLKQNKKNRFNLSAIDEAGNISASVQITIKEEGKEEEKEAEKSIAKPFTDISGHWGESYIETLRLAGIIQGYADGTFGPNKNVNRAELTIMALNAFNYEMPTRIENKPFPDVDLNIWYTSAIEKAKNENIVAGFPDGNFMPGEYITRAAALKIIFEAAKLDVRQTDDTFPDVPEDAWFAKYCTFAKTKKISQGYEDGTFQPGKKITRAEIAVLLTKAMSLKKETASEMTI